MAIVRAVKSGNWSDTTVWNTGALPTSADDVYSNTFTVTIDVSPTVLSISNAAATGVTAGGSFAASVNGIVITANVLSGSTSVNCLAVAASGASAISVIGNVSAGSGNGAAAISMTGTGTLSITGAVTGSATTQGYGVILSSAGTVNITGNCTGGNAANSAAALNNSTGTLNITGSCTAGGTSIGAGGPGAWNNNQGAIVVIGTVQSSNAVAGVVAQNINSTTILSGPFVTSTNGVNPVYANRWLWQNTNPPATYYQIRSANLAVIRPLYTADSVGGNPAVSNVRSGTVYGPSNELTGTCAVPPAGSVALGVPVDNTTGTAAITAANIRSAVGLASANLDAQLAAIPTTAAPTAAAVASAVWAAATRTLTTTIPAASDIAAAVWSAVTRTITGGTVDTLTNAPSVPSAAAIASQVRTELATELARLDAAISTRLASSSYTTPPTASAIATAVNSALDRTGFSLTSAERQAIATAVEQSILNENDGQAILNAIVGAIGNQNIDQVALVAAIRADLERSGGTLATRSTLTAGQVRTELAPELGNLDATISSRLPSSGYTAPPSAASIATSVWSAATRTLTTAFDSSATIAAAVWSAATRTLTSSSAPSAADNAAAVWGYSSGRTVTGGTVDTVTNSTPVDAGEIADAVRTELTPELARLSNAATTQEVGDIVEEALQ